MPKTSTGESNQKSSPYLKLFNRALGNKWVVGGSVVALGGLGCYCLYYYFKYSKNNGPSIKELSSSDGNRAAQLERKTISRNVMDEASNLFWFLDENGTERFGQDLGDGVAKLLKMFVIDENGSKSVMLVEMQPSLLMPFKTRLSAIKPTAIFKITNNFKPNYSNAVGSASLNTSWDEDVKHPLRSPSPIHMQQQQQRRRFAVRPPRYRRQLLNSSTRLATIHSSNRLSHQRYNRRREPIFDVTMLSPTTLAHENQICVPPHAFGVASAHLGVVIKSDCKAISIRDAGKYILGYCVCLNVEIVTDSKLSLNSKPTFPTFRSTQADMTTCLGPYVVNTDQMGDPNRARISLYLNGQELLMDFDVSSLPLSVPKLISKLSKTSTLPAGSIVLAGTKHNEFSTQTYLSAGDVISACCTGIGTLRCPIVSSTSSVDDGVSSAAESSGEKKITAAAAPNRPIATPVKKMNVVENSLCASTDNDQID
mmetsp:Transcript_29068/g.51093  ORF Transcript_29068/g.51093 Transcript_29068/m.51093 type:complete len:481 (+) Transcript_29068:58-1500(+)|eukprot:CAMPEP_0197539718 /NCGR_PEP_ID=MMETSP1318-20131121/63612_1 /TAXON_ID=552666 /ORGANISM="Partenskyella glossopodia, Strain RCC365" /LENGTH=480 /DNA_ID=CAMNT_0043098499 /DNA_START=34 /DNA_END=1476 /DNA_ORIENTATION=+